MERNACPLPLSEGDRYGHLRTKANGHTLMGWREYESCVNANTLSIRYIMKARCT